MKCPFCNNPETNVKDSRNIAEKEIVRRRRFCTNCKGKFSTFERVQLKEFLVIKKSGLKKPYDRKKIVDSISTAVRKRNVSLDQIELLADDIYRKLSNSGEKEIHSKRIGEMIMRELAEIDQVSYIRFASVYKDFRDAADFAKFINAIVGKK